MSSSCKSRIPERVKHSLTALHGPNSRISRARSLVRSNRCSLFRSRLPLPIRTMALALCSEVVKRPEVPKPMPKARETETEAVIRSLVRRSIPPAVRGNRTSFRRIQMAHSLPQVASVSLVMKPPSRWQNQNQNQQPPTISTPQEDQAEDDVLSARTLLELVAGKWQPDMQSMRFLCSDHRLINVPNRLMNRHSVIMGHLEALEQPIELRAVRSVTLLRVIMWMHQNSLSGEMTTSSVAADKQSCICDNQSGNGNEENDMCDVYSVSESENTNTDDDSSTESSESTQEIESIKYEICKGYTRSRCESTESTMRTERINNRIYRPYSKEGLESDDENCYENYENAENVKYRKLNGGNENVMVDHFRSKSVRRENTEENAGRPTSNSNNSKLNKANGNELNANGSVSYKENEITNRYSNSQHDPKDSGILRENSGKNNGNENGKEQGFIEGELSEHNIFRTNSSQRKPNLSERNVNVNTNEETSVTTYRRKASECEQKLAPNMGPNQKKCELSSWELRLLGSELYQLVELILAAHYLGIDVLTLRATHHFGDLMAQRTRSERCLMLRIRTHLAGVHQTLDNHRPLIREIMMRYRRSGGPFLSTTEPPLLLARNRHRHHQNCFHTRM